MSMQERVQTIDDDIVDLADFDIVEWFHTEIHKLPFFWTGQK